MRLFKILFISLAKIAIQGNYKKEVRHKELYGELITVDINGKKVKMRHHKSNRRNAPVYIDIHGGGWTWGTIECGDQLLHNYVSQLDCEAYSINYPMIPWAYYPKPYEHLYEVIKYMAEHAEQFNIDPEKIFVGGRSAGGSAAATLSLMAKDRGDFKVCCQCLEYPLLDLTMTLIDDKDRYVQPPALPIFLLKWLSDSYASKKQQKEIYCSPLLASKEQLEGLPPAIVMTCELDSVRQDGELYAQRLRDAGVDVTYMCFQNVLHGFDEEDTEDARKAQQYYIDNLKRYM